MARRFAWVLLLGGFGLVSQIGCQSISTSSYGSPWLARRTEGEAAPAGDQDADKRTLPPEKAAQLCLATAQLLEKDGHDGEAIQQYEKARQYNPHLTNATCRRLAILYDRQGDFTKALAEYHNALQVHAKDADLFNDVGYCYFQMADWPQAEKWFRQSVEINPNHQRAWINLGMTLGQQERYADSLAAFKKAVGPAEAQCNLAFVYSTQGKHAEAHQAYMMALNIQPDLQLARAALTKLMGGDLKSSSADAGNAGPDRKEQVAAMARLSGFVREQLSEVGETPTVKNSGDPAVVEATAAPSIGSESDAVVPAAAEQKRQMPSTRPISLTRASKAMPVESQDVVPAKPIAVAVPRGAKDMPRQDEQP